MSSRERSQVLDVSVRDGLLTISVGVECLGNAVEYMPDTDLFPKVTAADLFASELAAVLEQEDESGATLVQRMLDAAAVRAIEDGARGVVLGS